LLAGRGERRTRFIAHKKRPSELFLQKAHARTDGCLRDVQAIGGFDEASGRNDLNECAGKLNVHSSSSIINAFNCQFYSLVGAIGR
jgi:hypothetical protein